MIQKYKVIVRRDKSTITLHLKHQQAPKVSFSATPSTGWEVHPVKRSQ
jgi:hypothetical protein